MRDIIYNNDTNHVVLLGGTPMMVTLGKALMRLGYQFTAYTSPRQEAEIGERDGVNVFVSEDINTDINYPLIEDPKTLILGIGEAWVFGERIRKAADDRLLAFMSIPLPRYRGGAHISWAIMRDESHWGGCLQLVTENTAPGEFDDGEIVHRWDYTVPRTCRIPQHWFDFCGKEDIAAICAFLKMVSMRKAFHAVPVDNTQSLFLPRLKTAINGWIDWSQQVNHLEKFICAFDDPYPGAMTMLGDRIVSLKDVDWDGLTLWNPSFERGLVIRIDDGIHISAMRGTILARRVLCEGVNITDQVKVGQRLWTPAERLEMALATTPTYTAKA